MRAGATGAGATKRIRVIGLGNLDAGDDGAGILAARRVHAELGGMPGLDVVEAGPALAVLDLLDGIDVAVVVDALHDPTTMREPGSVVRIEGTPEGLPVELDSSLSSHGIGLGETLGLAAALGRLPALVFVGIEVAGVEVGRQLSPPVAAHLPELVQRIVDEVELVAGGGRGAP